MFYNERLDGISPDLMDTLREQFARCEGPDWVRPAGLDKGESVTEALEDAREFGLPGVSRLQILETAPDEVRAAIDSFEPPAEAANEGTFFRGFEVIVSYDDGELHEVKLAGVYQD